MSIEEFADKIGLGRENLEKFYGNIKANLPRLKSSLFNCDDRSDIRSDIDSLEIHGSMEIIEQLRNFEIELAKANTDNQKITSELKTANVKIDT